ncbi:MAG: hypothetical protein K6C34_04180 [Alphaproteobacteria bacterium]|nr:hypothetical protein [Alphaproteobacteria bacterium]
MSDFRYDELVQKALISVVREVLEDVAKNGLSDNHHFYIRFRTDHPRTKIPSYLKKQYPEEIMIVLQHQFWNLKTYADRFSVDLSFNGCQETLTIPFSSLTAFVDPSVKFALQFTPSFESDGSPDTGNRETRKTEVEHESESDDGKIISFDSFRKK